MREQLDRLEAELKKIAGVKNARIIGAETPEEIHIVATATRSPKQIVRDVQSLAAAAFSLPIDHRIVSVVQLDDSEPPPPPTTIKLDPAPVEEPEPATVGAPAHHDDRRPVLERVVLGTRGSAGWVEVGLKWPDGTETDGSGNTGPSRETRARGAAKAVVKALEPVLHDRGVELELDQVIIHRMESADSVFVRATFFEGGSAVPVVGSAIVHDDVASAAVRALLHAVNRKLT
ncbi:MAG TPA: hypothetical protein VHI71_04525 [Actinomycetota bacterium]|nr:hypothetical protein [Actinomycetota bacterium]